MFNREELRQGIETFIKEQKKKKKPTLRFKLTLGRKKRSFKVIDRKAPLDFSGIALPIARSLNYHQIAKELFTIQPLPQPSSLLYFYDEVPS